MNSVAAEESQKIKTIASFLDSSPQLTMAINEADRRAAKVGRLMSPADLLDSIFDQENTINELQENKIKRVKEALALAKLDAHHIKRTSDTDRQYGFDLTNVLFIAEKIAKRFGAKNNGPMTVVAAFTNSYRYTDPVITQIQEVLQSSGITLDSLFRIQRASDNTATPPNHTFESLGFGEDITKKMRDSDGALPLVGMDAELRRLATVLTSKQDSVVIVGEPGVGKTAVVEGLSAHIALKTRPLIPRSLEDITIVSISMIDLLGGTSARGELEEKLKKMLNYFSKHKNVVPFFDEIHLALDTEDPTCRTIATALKPAMANGSFRCIGASTDREYARFISSDAAMNSRFTKILLQEPSKQDAKEILNGIKHGLIPQEHKSLNLNIPIESINTAVEVTSDYQVGECLPRKAIQLLRKAIANCIYTIEIEEKEDREVLPADVASTFSQLSGIPVDELLGDRDLFYDELQERLNKRVFGQKEAINATCEWLKLQARGWSDSRRPRGRFLYLGPPGTGKTELALNIADEVMKDKGSLIIKNMGEYKGEGAKAKFMGADPGYVGYGEVSTVYKEVLMRPYSVVILDEFEKASPELSDVLLSIFSGSGADSQGKVVDFSQCIFVLTSNALDEIGGIKDEGLIRKNLLELGGVFTPPLVDRLDRVVQFNELSEEDCKRVLNNIIDQRSAKATKRLPEILQTEDCINQILDNSRVNSRISVRSIERSLNIWLQEYLSKE